MTSDLHPKKRTLFLNVLCILSFVDLGINILISAIGFLYSSLADTTTRDPSGFMTIFENSPSASLRDLVVELVSLSGVILMWRLQRVGYLIYVFAECFLYFEFLYLVSSHSFSRAETKQIGIEMLWPLPLDIAFFIMYATQLKHMRKGMNINPSQQLT